MNRSWSTALLVLALLILPSTPALAGEAEARDTFGPYAGGSPDSGTCGNDWATDTFKRLYHVSRRADGSYAVREAFIDGRFLTVAGASPGACQGGTGHGTLIRAGVSGSFGGYLDLSVSGGTYDPAASCPAPCNGSLFLASHFGPAATWTVDRFIFAYHAAAPALTYRAWVNASPDLGGNRGDIAN